MTKLILTACAFASLLSMTSGAQAQRQDYIRHAQKEVERKMEADWKTNVNISWTSSNTVAVPVGSQVRVRGAGRVTRTSDRRVGDFTSDVVMSNSDKRIRRATYSVSRWDSVTNGGGLGNWRDQTLRQKTRKLVEERLDQIQRDQLTVTFSTMEIVNIGSTEKLVRGQGTMKRPSGTSSGRFTYGVRFDRSGNEKLVNVSVQTNPGDARNDDWRHGDEARLAKVAQNAAADDMRKRYGDGDFQWTGQPEHYYINDREAGVRGKARYRRAGNRDWMDFTYEANVDAFDMRAKRIRLEVDDWNQPDNDWRNVSNDELRNIAHEAVDRRFNTSTRIVWHSSNITTVSSDRKKVSGEFTAVGGQSGRYAYEVVIRQDGTVVSERHWQAN